ncbi:MAG: TetR/AcrR family transcriptional regulator [Pseudomonadota bacterium]|nr:TetR/AcrR family transcriptional regulator [Pseudomonadota bacterium]
MKSAARPASKTKTPAAPAPDRAGRRKRETRQRLLDAAFLLTAERGVDAVAINDITNAADVGIGSFYNHFDSKDAIYAAVTDDLFETFADALDRVVASVDDPAEIVSICVRHTILRARREPLWGRVLLREGLSARMLSRGLGARLMRDLRKGVDSRRFKVGDQLMTFATAGGTVLAAVALELNQGDRRDESMKEWDVDARDIPVRAALALLQTLGVPADQARRIARKPLPAVDP